MSRDSLVSNARKLLSSMLDESGAILYSAWETLCPGRYYILGLNPGGNTGPTIREHLNELKNYTENAYLDEDWSSKARNYGVGGHPLQVHLKSLLQGLGYDLRNICASNLIFSQSPNQYGAYYPAKANQCWDVHKMIINIVQPKILLVFGNGSISPYNYLQRKHNEQFSKWPKEKVMPSGHATWVCRSFETTLEGKKRIVIGLPHLSRYSINGKFKVLQWIKNIIG
jgi:hypothetical protein